MPLRIVFMGTADFAVPTLVGLVGRGHEVVAVYTRAPKPAGRRGLDLTPSPVEREARRFALPLLTPATLRTAEAANTAHGHGADGRRPFSSGPRVVRSISTHPCCRAGAVLPRSTVPSWPVIPRPVSW